MTPTQVELVQTSFSRLQPTAAKVGRIFYERLFELDPALRLMFRGDMEEQSRKLMHMLATAVAMLKRPEQLLPVVESLGRRHASYGVVDEHYVKVGAALIWTLQRGLGEAFTAEVCDAWVGMYEWVTATMRSAAAVAAA